MNIALSEQPGIPHALQVANLNKSYRGKAALRDIGFTVPPASFTAILGPAGAGKTTTLRLIAGLETPDSGDVILAGQNAVHQQPKDRDIAMIFDNIALYPNKSGFENIASPLVIRKEPKKQIEQKVAEIAATLQISHILGRLPKTMSGGERQRIALGRALIRSPQLFLLDEPLSSLDAKLRIELRAELRRLQQDLGYTFLLATPDFQEALAIADTVIMLSEGEVVQIGAPQELYDKPINRNVAQFIGAPQINLLETRWVVSGDETHIHFAGSAHTPPPHFRYTAGLEQSSFELGIRPENFKITTPDAGAIKGTVVDIEPLGLKSVLTLESSEAEFRLTTASSVSSGIEIGQTVGVDIVDSSKLLAFNKDTGNRL